MAKIDLGAMIKSVPEYVKTHWKTPGKGEYLSLREMGAYCMSQSGVFVFGTVQGIMSFSASYFCGAIMGIAAMDFYIISIIGTVLGYLLMFMNPLGVLIYENHGRLTKNMKIFANCCYLGQIIIGLSLYFVPSQQFEFIMKGFPQILGNILFVGGMFSYVNWFIRRKFSAKYGRLKPMILACGVPAAVLMSIIPFLPVQNLNYTLKLVILHFAFTFTNNFVGNFTNVAGMATFMTPSSQERQRLYSIIPIITGLTPSLIGMFFPMLIATTGGYLNLTTYKVFVPIFCLIGLVMTYFVAACKERIIEPPVEKREKVTFWRGAKYVLRDKYLWMLKISNLFGLWQWLANSLLAWWFIYSLRMEWFSGIAGNIVVLGMTLSNLITPVLTKKFEKRTILLAARGTIVLTTFGLLWGIKAESIFIFMAFLFLRNCVTPIDTGINSGLAPDILMYHQWKYGERADAMMGVFDWFLGPVGMLLGFIVPYVQKLIGFTSDWDVLYDTAIINEVFSLYIWMTIIGTVLCTVPFFFYDLTKEKYAVCVKELQERVEEAEHEDESEAALSQEVQG